MSASGWFLVAVNFCGPIDLKDPVGWSYLIGTADWINHAMISREEIASALRDLSRRGLLAERHGHLVRTRKAATAFERMYGKRKRMSVMKLWEAAEEFIDTQAARHDPLKPPTRKLYERALAAYHERMRNS